MSDFLLTRLEAAATDQKAEWDGGLSELLLEAKREIDKLRAEQHGLIEQLEQLQTIAYDEDGNEYRARSLRSVNGQ